MDIVAHDARRQRGAVIATKFASAFRQIHGDVFFVPSQTTAGSGYVVHASAGTCSCPDFEKHAANDGDGSRTPFVCKHRAALSYYRREWALPEGGVLVTESVRLTYPQKWPEYQAAQISELDCATRLARSLCNGIPTPPQHGRGRRYLPLEHLLFCAIMRAYRCLSSRRSMSDIRALAERGLIPKAPSFVSMLRAIERPDLTPVYERLLSESARPMASVERCFAVDATGFSTCTWGTASWYEFKHEGDERVREWKKFNAVIGVKTNVIVSGSVTDRDDHDSPEFQGLVERALASGFRIDEMYGDKAYLAHKHLNQIRQHGGRMYVPFKPNSSGTTGDDEWDFMHDLFSLNRAAFDSRYYKRENVEATFSGLKRKFGPTLRSRILSAMTNEIYIRAICWNLSMLVHAIHELKLTPEFWTSKRTAA